MGNIFWYVGLILYFCEIASATEQENDETNDRRLIVDPITNLFSEVGNLILDIDETLAKQIAPKVEFEGRVEERILEDRTPLGEYFAQIQRNYRNLRKKIGPAISKGVSDLLTGRSAYRGNINERDGNTIDASTPFVPLGLLQTPKRDKEAEATEASIADGKEEIPSSELNINEPSSEQKNKPSEVSLNPFAKYDHEKKVTEPVTEETLMGKTKSSDISRNPFAKHDHEKTSEPKIKDSNNVESIISEVVKRTDNLLQNAQRTNDLLLSLGRKTLDDTTAFVRRRGETSKPPDNNLENNGRILGDVLYSESMYDDYMRQLLKNHGKWLLDNPLLNPKRNKQASKDIPQGIQDNEVLVTSEHESLNEKVTTEGPNLGFADSRVKSNNILFQKVNSNEVPEGSVSGYHDLTKVEGERKEILDNIMHSTKNAETRERGDEPEESVILAFTLDGMPLKLRMGPEFKNPIKFLHKALRTAGVSLNILVQSYHNIEPARGEILQLGSISGGIVTRARQFDLSNSIDLKSLLKKLKKSKPPRV